MLYQFCKKSPIEKSNKELFAGLGIITLASAAIGVGLAAAATAIFPGAMLGMGPAFLTSAVIAGIALITAALATEYIVEPIAEKVNEHVISPVIKKISECFPQKG